MAPTGEVTFSAVGAGAFGSPTCALAPGSASASSCSVTYTPTTSGDHQVTATFPSDVDHLASSSAPVVITIEPETVTDVTPPVIQIVSPADGTAIKKGRPIRVVATATDDVGVTRVEFAADGVVMCSGATDDVCLVRAEGWLDRLHGHGDRLGRGREHGDAADLDQGRRPRPRLSHRG